MTVLDAGLLDRVRRRIATSGAPPTAAAVAAALREEGGGLRGDVELLPVLRLLQGEIVGSGPLEPLLRDPLVTDVLVNAPDEVWVDRGSGLERSAVRFPDDLAVRRLAQRLAAPTGRRLDDAQPWVDARLADGVRLHAVLPPVAPAGTCLSLRVPRTRVFALEELVTAGSVPPDGAALLSRLVASRAAFLVTGGTGTGKTTLLSALLSLVDAGDRLLLVEDAGELAPAHPHVVRLEARPPNLEGAGAVTLRDLVRQALRMRPDRVVVGEVRGAEVVDLLAALNTGHEGGLTRLARLLQFTPAQGTRRTCGRTDRRSGFVARLKSQRGAGHALGRSEHGVSPSAEVEDSPGCSCATPADNSLGLPHTAREGQGVAVAMPTRWQSMLEASADEACLAVRLYNDPAQPRSFEAFVVHMHLAWLYLLQAQMTRDGVDYRYPDAKNPRRFVKVDGEFKRWDLASSVALRWASPQDSVRANLDFFIALRNKIEHRYARQQENMALALGGHSQALLLNYEEEVTGQFGPRFSLATRLRIPVFIGTFTPEGETALRRLKATLPKGLARFITDYTSGLDAATEQDSRFEFRMRVTLELATRDPEATAVQFTRLDDMTPEQRTVVEKMGRKGQVIVREQQRGVVNLGYLKPGEVVKRVAIKVPFEFRQDHFVQSWRRLDVRPAAKSANPERTKEHFCMYDPTHRDYVYTQTYVNHLVDRCQTEEGFREVTDRRPQKRRITKADLQAS